MQSRVAALRKTVLYGLDLRISNSRSCTAHSDGDLNILIYLSLIFQHNFTILSQSEYIHSIEIASMSSLSTTNLGSFRSKFFWV